MKTLKTLIRPVIPYKIRVPLGRLKRRLILSPKVIKAWSQYLRSPNSFLPEELALKGNLSFSEFQLLFLDGWYHDFEALGLKTGLLHPNQRCKQAPLFALIDQAISICKKQTSRVAGVELFCADGYYTNYAVKNGASRILGIDKDKFYIDKARLITRILGNSEKTLFDCSDVFELDDTFDFCICAGGLYHLSNPRELLRLLAARIRYALVIQTVYSLANTSDDYFERPAPGWTWGCRFSYEYLLKMVIDSGWTIQSVSANQLEGNTRLEDRGSAYLLCVPTGQNDD